MTHSVNFEDLLLSDLIQNGKITNLKPGKFDTRWSFVLLAILALTRPFTALKWRLSVKVFSGCVAVCHIDSSLALDTK